jgi:hypothetical protein
MAEQGHHPWYLHVCQPCALHGRCHAPVWQRSRCPLTALYASIRGPRPPLSGVGGLSLLALGGRAVTHVSGRPPEPAKMTAQAGRTHSAPAALHCQGQAHPTIPVQQPWQLLRACCTAPGLCSEHSPAATCAAGAGATRRCARHRKHTGVSADLSVACTGAFQLYTLLH